jgi:hypothetical protein
VDHSFELSRKVAHVNRMIPKHGFEHKFVFSQYCFCCSLLALHGCIHISYHFTTRFIIVVGMVFASHVRASQHSNFCELCAHIIYRGNMKGSFQNALIRDLTKLLKGQIGFNS